MSEQKLHFLEIDKGTFEILYQNNPVGWVRSDGPWNKPHDERWALANAFPAPSSNHTNVVLTFRFIDPSGDLGQFKAWLQANNHTYQYYMKHKITM